MAKRYDKEFKLHAVKQVTELNKSATQVARDLDVAYQTYVSGYKSTMKIKKNLL